MNKIDSIIFLLLALFFKLTFLRSDWFFNYNFGLALIILILTPILAILSVYSALRSVKIDKRMTIVIIANSALLLWYWFD